MSIDKMQGNKYVDINTAEFQTKIADFNLLIVTATEIEKKTLHSYMKPAPGHKELLKVFHGTQTYYAGLFGSYMAVHVNCDKMGAVSPGASIMTTEKAIQFCKPKAVLMPGIAMGVDSTKHKIGDVLVSEIVSGYDIQRIGKDEVLQRGVSGQASLHLLNRFKSVTDWTYKISRRQAKVIPGEVLSGEKLIDNPEYKALVLAQYPEAKGGEMEGYGVYSTCITNQVPWIVVKAICDYGDGNKKKNKEKNQNTASNSAINLCHHVFTSREAFNDIGLTCFSVDPIATTPKKNIDAPPTPADVESIIITEMTTIGNGDYSPDSGFVRDTVRDFLTLSDPQKIEIAKRLNVYDDSLSKLYPHKRDLEIFVRITKGNLIEQLKKELTGIRENRH